ncbi:hypothetical protein [Solibacillus merdavium]|uniref:Abortive phage infection protein n=1 Tax=Solibacillus merdavium TaxID=2762218 RepID=A0ABR8XI02_9BACL|nr:hypothetical protein [Solibacillus merdavium]MBD8031571.1 hypothetical protein [Solibacillus merdavium]
MADYQAILDQLRNGEVKSVLIKKSEFLQFREHLVKDQQFKHFRGVAKQGGDVEYTFLKNPRT